MYKANLPYLYAKYYNYVSIVTSTLLQKHILIRMQYSKDSTIVTLLFSLHIQTAYGSNQWFECQGLSKTSLHVFVHMPDVVLVHLVH